MLLRCQKPSLCLVEGGQRSGILGPRQSDHLFLEISEAEETEGPSQQTTTAGLQWATANLSFAHELGEVLGLRASGFGVSPAEESGGQKALRCLKLLVSLLQGFWQEVGLPSIFAVAHSHCVPLCAGTKIELLSRGASYPQDGSPRVRCARPAPAISIPHIIHKPSVAKVC